MFSTTLGRLRAFSLADGISFLVLLGIAMPLKYLAGWPWGVKVVGALHGFLFLGLCLFILLGWKERRWSILRPALIFACAFLPAAPFFLDRSLRKEAAEG